MRHGKKLNHLGRTNTHRKAMMANMASSLIKHKRISTTLAKAKALRTYIEPLITKAKNDTTHSRRTIFAYLQDKEVVTILFREIAEKVATRPGGYTRIIKLNNRLGDNAEMALIELVDYNTVYGNTLEEKKTTRRSRRRGGKTSGESDTIVPVSAETTQAVDETVDTTSSDVVTETAAQENVNSNDSENIAPAVQDGQDQSSVVAENIEAPVEVVETDKTFENETNPEATAATPQASENITADEDNSQTPQA